MKNVLLLSTLTVATITSVCAGPQQSKLGCAIDYTNRETVMSTVDHKAGAKFCVLFEELSDDKKIGGQTALAANAFNKGLRPFTNPIQLKEDLLKTIMADTCIPDDKKEQAISLTKEVIELYSNLRCQLAQAIGQTAFKALTDTYFTALDQKIAEMKALT